MVPLFAEVRQALDEAFSMADEGATWVIPMLAGKPSKNLGTTFKKIIRRAGVEVWPKPFQNLRSSCQTELEQKRPKYVVCHWLGNTPAIANKTLPDGDGGTLRKGRPRTGGLTGDKRGTQPPVSPRNVSQEKTRTPYEVRENVIFAEVVDILEMPEWRGQDSNLRPRGYEEQVSLFA